MTFHARDQMMWITGHRKARKGPETSCHRVRIHFVRARKSNDRLRITDLQQLIRPIASMDTFIIRQASFAVLLMRYTVRTLYIASRTVWTVRIDAEQVFTAGRRQRCRIVRTMAALYCPIVVTVIVNGTLAIEQQTILALFQRQRAIGAEKELIAVLCMTVGLNAVLFGAFSDSGSSD